MRDFIGTLIIMTFCIIAAFYPPKKKQGNFSRHTSKRKI